MDDIGMGIESLLSFPLVVEFSSAHLSLFPPLS